MSLPKENVLPKLRTAKLGEQGRSVEKEKRTESKIALEVIESEKLELNLAIDKNCLSLVTDEEISKLTNEVENIKIKNSELDAGRSEADEIAMSSRKSEAKNLDGKLMIFS